MDTSATASLPRLVTTQRLAEELGVSVINISHGRYGRGEFANLPYYRVGRRVRYDVNEVRRWLDARRVGGAR